MGSYRWKVGRREVAVYSREMAKTARRGLTQEFLEDLQTGLLSQLRERVREDRSLCIELREDYINIYYRGGSLMKVSRTNTGFSAFFDTKYFESAEPPVPLPSSELKGPADVAAWVKALPWLKQAMDLFLGKHPKDEREIQQQLLRDNNFATCARSTDYYICDIEYANTNGRFDAVAVHWPSTPTDRKKPYGRRLVLAEVKCGDGALDGLAGLHSHIIDVNAFLADPSNVATLKCEMVRVFNQKRKLVLIDCDKDILSFSDELPLLLLVFVNHDPGKMRLRELLTALPPSPHAELRVATACLLGYGLYDLAILTVQETVRRLEGCI